MATARNRLEDASRVLFAARSLIGAGVMIRVFLRMTKVIENVMDLMGRCVNQEREEQRRDKESRPAAQRASLVIDVHGDPGNHS